MEVALTKGPDRGLVIEGVGSFRARGGFFLRARAELTALDGRVWHAEQTSRWKPRVVVSDATGAEPARFEDGMLTAGGAAYELPRRPSALTRDGTAVATFATRWVSGAFTTTFVDMLGDVDPLVLLMATWIYRQRAIDSARVSA